MLTILSGFTVVYVFDCHTPVNVTILQSPSMEEHCDRKIINDNHKVQFTLIIHVPG